MRVLIKAIAPAGFFRCGVHWPEAGQIASADDFTAEQWAVLLAEPNLRTGPAPDEAVTAAGGADDGLRAALREAIGTLDPADFGEDGLPKVDALRRALPAGTKGVTKALVAEVWAGLKPAG